MDTQIAPARVLTGDNPFGVDPQADLLSPPRHDVPGWSETMYFGGWSPESGVGVWTHLGIVPEDKSLWWAQVFALLPDGVVLVDRSFGRPTSNWGPETGNLKVECVKPGRSWRLRFDGAGEISSSAALAAGPVGAGIAAPFSFEIDLDAVVPVYDMHKAMSNEVDYRSGSARRGRGPGPRRRARTARPGPSRRRPDSPPWNVGNIHHEQGFAMTGRLDALGRSWDLTGSAIRDHSVGIRDFSAYGPQAHLWNYIVWPESRRAMGTFTMWRPKTGEPLASMFVITENGRTEVGGDVRLTGVAERGAHPREHEISVVRPDESTLTLPGRVVHNLTITYAEPNHNLNGAVDDPGHGLTDQLVADETTTAWTWPGGEVGFGNGELAFRRSDLPSVTHPLPAGSRLSG